MPSSKDFMVPWTGVASVIAGMVARAAVTVVTIVLLPLLGFMIAEVVGNLLPIWVFTLPVAISSALGGAIAGYLQGDNTRRPLHSLRWYSVVRLDLSPVQSWVPLAGSVGISVVRNSGIENLSELLC